MLVLCLEEALVALFGLAIKLLEGPILLCLPPTQYRAWHTASMHVTFGLIVSVASVAGNVQQAPHSRDFLICHLLSAQTL